jgi:hypothetical protein
MRLLCTIAFVGLLLVTNITFGENGNARPKSVQAADRTYAETIESAKKVYDRAASEAHAVYLAALERALTEETQAGHLDAALAIRVIRNAAKKSGPPVIQKMLGKSPEQAPLVPGDVDKANAARIDWARLHKSSGRVKAAVLEPVILKESDDKEGWQRVPEVFKRHRTAVYMGTGRDDGVADFEVIKDGTILLACNYSYQGNESGNWVETRWAKEQFTENGWTEVPQDQLGGVLVSGSGKEQVIFMKQVKRGEKYRLRCNKYEPPHVIVFF